MNKTDYLEHIRSLPEEIVSAVASIDLEGFVKKAVDEFALNAEQEADLEERLSAFLADVWYERHYASRKIIPEGLSSEKIQALRKRIDADFLSPIVQSLDEAGLGPECVLYEKGVPGRAGSKPYTSTAEHKKMEGYEDRPPAHACGNRAVRLTVQKLNSHEIERIGILGKGTGFRTRFLSSRRVYYHDLVLHVDYSDRGRWGDDETLVVRFPTKEELASFTGLLEKAIHAGLFTHAVNDLRHSPPSWFEPYR